MQAVPGAVWTFEQMQTLGFSSVATVVRMTVIKLSSGGLWVHAPIAPTRRALWVPPACRRPQPGPGEATQRAAPCLAAAPPAASSSSEPALMRGPVAHAWAAQGVRGAG